MSDNIIRKSILELESLNHNDVVKVAGVVRRLKNFLKKITNPEFKAKLEQFNEETKNVKSISFNLSKTLDKLTSAIKDGNIEEYKFQLTQAKEVIQSFWENLNNLDEHTKDVTNIMYYYSDKEMKDPKFLEKLKTQLPSNYDLEFDKVYKKPLKSFTWYENLTSENIYIRGGEGQTALSSLLDRIEKALLRDGLITSEKDSKPFLSGDKLAYLLNNFKKSIVDGELISAQPKKPSKKITKIQAGQTVIIVTTAPFQLPNTDILLQAQVQLIDMRTSLAARQKISLQATTNVTILSGNKIAYRKDFLKKIALATSIEIERKETNLSEIDLAKVLLEGYKKAFNQTPSLETLGIGWAQVVLESGRPIKLPNNNIGNIKAEQTWLKSGKPYFIKTTSEFTSEGKPFTHQNAKWRAYSTPVEGAVGYWNLIGRKYPEALKRMEDGDPESTSVALAMNNYFTANIKQYAAGVSSLYKEFLTKIAPQIPDLKSGENANKLQKLPIKSWKDEYSDTYPTKAEVPPNSKENINVNNLLNDLYSAPLYNFVKNAILEKKLPITKNIILLKCNSLPAKIEYAKQACNILNRFVDTNSTLHSNNKELEIQCSTLGTALTTTKAIQAICDCLSTQLKLSTSIDLAAIVIPGFLSRYEQINNKKVEKYSRLFYLERVKNG